MIVTSELRWTLPDYRREHVDPPHRIVSNPDKSEGEMMSDEEIEEYIKDSIATLRILADKKSPRYNDLVYNYMDDLAYLQELGAISEDDYNELTRPNNLRFHTL